MRQFFSLVRYEYTMSTRRWGMWIAFGLVFLLYATRTVSDLQSGLSLVTDSQVWEYAGRLAINLNLFMPVVGGIVAADRMARDVHLGMAELQRSTPVRRWPFILSKYTGVLLSLLTPQALSLVLLSALALVLGASPMLLPYVMVAFVTIVVPAYAFITIFSLACPLLMPLRVYQVLFTGYWLWGNYLDPQVFPTISDTLFTTCGLYAYEGFFGGTLGSRVATHTSLDALLNLLVLALCVGGALVMLERYPAWQARSA